MIKEVERARIAERSDASQTLSAAAATRAPQVTLGELIGQARDTLILARDVEANSYGLVSDFLLPEPTGTDKDGSVRPQEPDKMEVIADLIRDIHGVIEVTNMNIASARQRLA